MSVFDDVAEALADIWDQMHQETLAPADAAPLIAAQLELVSPSQFLQFAKIEQVLGRITGLFFVDGPPDGTLGGPGASAIDLTNHLFYGPKDAVTGWPAGVAFVGATGPAGTITGATAVALSAGAAPTVTLGGTPTARTFQFGIPAPDISNLAVTWNDAADQVGLSLDITDTLSGAGSLALRLRKGGSLLASITKAGAGWLAAGLTLGAALTAPSAALAGNLDLTTNAAQVRLGAAQDVVLNRDGAADILAQYRGTNAQTLRVYETRTDALNYSRAALYFSGANAVLEAQAAGTGTLRSLILNGASVGFQSAGTTRFIVGAAGHFFAQVDNTYDIGASGANRPRTIYTNSMYSASLALTTSAGVNRGFILASADGVINLYNSGVSDFSRLTFGGTTSSFPALKRSGTEIHVRVADDSTFGTLIAGGLFARFGYIGLGASDDVVLNRDAADTLAQRRGTNAQAFRVYNIYTDASNYERAAFGYVSNTLEIGHDFAGTGAARNVRIRTAGTGSASLILATTGTDRWYVNNAGHFLAIADNTYDIGQSGATRPRNIYAGSNIFAPLLVEVGASGTLGFSGRSSIISPSDGVLTLLNNAGTGFTRLNIGGSTSAFPTIKRSSAGIDFRLADDSGLTFIGASSLVLNGQATLTADASHIAALRSGTNAQFLRIFNTYTDASNSERLALGWNSNTCFIATENAGTGSTRSMVIRAGNGLSLSGSSGSNAQWDLLSSGTLRPSAHNAYDLAQAAVRIRSGYFSTDVVVGRTIKTEAMTVASLPSAATVGAGSRSFVTDATATTFLSVVAGGGANAVPVVSDGTNWLIA